MNADVTPPKFRVAFSLAGEQGPIVSEVADILRKEIGPDRVFYYAFEGPETLVGRGFQHFKSIYQDPHTLVIPCVSKEYNEKPWTQFEWQIIRHLLDEAEADDEPRDGLNRTLRSLRIFPIRVGPGDVNGLSNDIITHTIKTPEETAKVILKRLHGLENEDPKLTAFPIGKCIYLSICPAELLENSQLVKREYVKIALEKQGWTVLPADDHQGTTDYHRAKREMQRSLAFVQLLSAIPSQPLGIDVTLYEMARELRLPAFRFSCAGNLDGSDSSHRNLVTQSDVFRDNFIDFITYMNKGLAKLEMNPVHRGVFVK